MRHVRYLAAGVALSLFALPVAAATFFGGDLVSISSPVNDDAYGAGEAVSVSADIGGDAYFAGGQVTVGSEIQQDLMLAGGKVYVESTVNDDARIVGGDMIVSGTIADDALLVGGTITIPSGATIGGDAVLLGGMIIVDGTINGNAMIKGGRVILNGSINGAADIKADELSVNGSINGPARVSGFTMDIGSDARFSAIEYWRSAGEITFGEDQVLIGAQFNSDLSFSRGKTNEAQNVAVKLAFAWFFFSLLSAAVIIALVTWMYKHSLRKVGEFANSTPGKSFLYGFLYFLLTPLVVILLFITVVGWPLALALTIVYALTLVFAKAVSSVVIIHWIAAKQKQQWKPFTIFLMSIVAYIILKLLMLVPLLGWIAVLIVVSIAFGALFQFKIQLYNSLEKGKK